MFADGPRTIVITASTLASQEGEKYLALIVPLVNVGENVAVMLAEFAFGIVMPGDAVHSVTIKSPPIPGPVG